MFTSRPFRRVGLLCLIVGCFLLSLGYLANLFADLVRIQAAERNLKTLDYGIERIDNSIESIETALRILDISKNPLEQNIHMRLQTLLFDYPELRHVWITNDIGQVVQATYAPVVGVDMSEWACFQEAKSSMKTVVSDYITGFGTGKQIVTVCVPFFREAEFKGTITASIDPSQFNEVLQDIVSNEKAMALTILDRKLMVLASSHGAVRGSQFGSLRPAEAALSGERGYLSQSSPVFHDKRLYVYGSLRDRHWAVVLSQPMQQVYGPWLGLLVDGVPFIAICLLLLLGLTYQIIKLEDMRRVEALEFQTEKANAVAELAAGVAHEIRNPITAVRGFMQLLSVRGDDPKVHEYARFVMEEVDNVEGIIGEFLSVAKPHAIRREKCDINDVLQRVYMLSRGRALNNNVEVLLSVSGECIVLGDGGHLKQAFLNLCTNAIQAMPMGGVLNISTACTAGKTIVRIQDTGEGIRPQHLKRLGERFFTTKRDGSGLGLAVTYRIIENHQGKVTVTSALGVGTEFIVTLPIFT